MRKNIFKIIISAALCLLLAVSPIFFSILYAFNLPSQYDKTYVAAMSDKVNYLKSIKGKKVVLIGGSNLPFGIDSELLSEKLEEPVVDFGLYAALGTKVVMDLSKSGLSSGDTVIFSIEYSTQTYSKYVNTETTLQMLDADYSLSRYLAADDMLQLFGGISDFIKSKSEYIELGAKPAPGGPYSRDSFNKYGDIEYQRPYNIMPEMYDAANKPMINKSIISRDFVDYFNSYSAWAKRRNISVFITFPPVNRMSVDNSEAEILEFYDFVCNNFNAKVISGIEDYIIHEDYFFDSNYHLNDTGVIYRTDRLLADLKRHSGDTSSNEIYVPDGSGAAPQTGGEITEGNAADNFEYTISNGRVTITGLSSVGKTQSSLTIPSRIEELPVYKISSGAFADNPLLESLTIPTSVLVFDDNIFTNSLNLRSIYLLLPTDINSPLPQVGPNLLAGTNANIKIYVAKNWYGKITTDYFWAKYKEKTAAIN